MKIFRNFFHFFDFWNERSILNQKKFFGFLSPKVAMVTNFCEKLKMKIFWKFFHFFDFWNERSILNKKKFFGFFSPKIAMVTYFCEKFKMKIFWKFFYFFDFWNEISILNQKNFFWIFVTKIPKKIEIRMRKGSPDQHTWMSQEQPDLSSGATYRRRSDGLVRLSIYYGSVCSLCRRFNKIWCHRNNRILVLERRIDVARIFLLG